MYIRYAFYKRENEPAIFIYSIIQKLVNKSRSTRRIITRNYFLSRIFQL